MTQQAWMLFLGVFVVSGCASPTTMRELKARNSKLEHELRTTRSRLEIARERQSILRTKVRLLETREVTEAEAPSLAAFSEGGVRSVAASNRRSLSHRPIQQRMLSSLDAVDQVLLRSVVSGLKKGARDEAFRDLLILAKSYPDSDRVAEGYFKMALFDYRALRFAEAEQGFQKVLTLNPRPRLQVGALLMTAIFSKHRDPEAARRTFEIIRAKYPQTIEAKRASAELVHLSATPRKRKTL